MMMEDVESTSHWVTGILDSLMGQIFQRLALEGDTSVLNIAFDVSICELTVILVFVFC